MISATEMFLQQYHLMADGIAQRAAADGADGHDQETSHGCVLYCTFRASAGQYAACSAQWSRPAR